MKRLCSALMAMVLWCAVQAQETDTISIDSAQLSGLLQEMIIIDSIENSFKYQYGTVDLGNGMATLQVPEGYKYLDPEQANYVLTQLWENPESETMGLLFPEYTSPVGDSMMYAVEISFESEGYIEDEDAADLDYDDLLETMQEDAKEINEMRLKQGYEAVEIVGWAAPPFYDAADKKLHWAKELKFGASEINTLNYNIRVLGRRGYLTLNAIGDMEILPEFQANITPILSSVEFNEGHHYDDFDPELDKVAAYGVGGLIAGKVLAKAGFFALIAKFWKFIAIGAIALFAGVKKFLFGGKGN